MTDSRRDPSHSSTVSTRVLLEQLSELNALERDIASAAPHDRSSPATLRLKSTAARSTLPTRRWWMSLGGVAVAASLLIIFMVNQRTPNPPQLADRNPLINVPDSTKPVKSGSDIRTTNASEPSASVLLTIVEGSDPVTGLPCASCRTVDLVATDGREQRLLAHAGPEVIQAAMNRTCSPSARRVVVVGLSGPAKALPATEAQATQLAQCIMAAPGAGSPAGDASLISSAAAACMPESVAVQVWAGSR
jgi:hypothetical protein